jgi:hypothetical protein
VCVCVFVHVQRGTLTIQPCTPSFQDDHMVASVLLLMLRPQPRSHAAIEFVAKVRRYAPACCSHIISLAVIVEFAAKIGTMIWAAVEYHSPREIRKSECLSVFTT